MMVDLAGIDAEMHLRHGDPRPLADWIESGRELTPYMREVLADILRGNRNPTDVDKKSPGIKRTWGQAIFEMQVLSGVDMAIRYGIVERGKGQKTRAMQYVAKQYNISVNTIKKYKRNEKKRSLQNAIK